VDLWPPHEIFLTIPAASLADSDVSLSIA